VIAAGTKPETQFEHRHPRHHLGRARSFRRGEDLGGAARNDPWSCYQSEELACGVCDSWPCACAPSEEAGVPDPIPYAIRPAIGVPVALSAWLYRSYDTSNAAGGPGFNPATEEDSPHPQSLVDNWVSCAVAADVSSPLTLVDSAAGTPPLQHHLPGFTQTLASRPSGY